jgi:hypothetical protein
MSFTYRDLIKDLTEAQKYKVAENALTAEQWALKLGWGLKKTQKYIKNQVIQGNWGSKRIPIIDVVGRRNYTFVYWDKTNKSATKK